tara:strand:+ start:1596 stop:2375 length:780 start_codon:yes stop_codon:yes gene_type:complete
MSEQEATADEQLVEEIVEEQEADIEELDTAPEEKEEVTEPEEPKVDYNKVIAQKAFESREHKREAESLRQELAAIKEKEAILLEPMILPVPDQYDDNYAEQMEARDKSIQDKAQYDASQRVRAEHAEYQRQQQNQEQINQVNERGNKYKENSIKLGVDQAQLGEAANIVANYGIRQDVAMELLSEEQGPLITMYLAQNPQALDAINTANAISLGNVWSDIKTKASSLQTKTTSTPDPVETQKGSGVGPKNRGPAGATYT